MPVRWKRLSEPRGARHPSSHVPIRAEQYTLDSRALPLSRNETIGGRPNGPLSRPLRQRTPNGKAPSGRPTLPTIPQQTADHPEHTVERGEHDSRTSPEKDDAGIDDEPLHHEAHRARTAATTTGEPALRAHTARVVERTRKRDTVAETHFQSDLSNLVGWYAAVSHCHAISHNVNTVLLQHAPNLLSLLLIYAGNANAAVDTTITALNNFELKRDTVQPKNYLPAQ